MHQVTTATLESLTALRSELVEKGRNHRRTRDLLASRHGVLEARGANEQAAELRVEIGSIDKALSVLDETAAELEGFIYRLAADSGGCAPLQQQPTHTPQCAAALRLPPGAVLNERRIW